MDFDKTSFSVDWFAPGDRYAPKRLSFPKSACISIDDLVSDPPLSFCFSPVDDAISRLRSYSFSDTPPERACGWPNSVPPSPMVFPDREPYPMYEQDPKPCAETLPTDTASLGLAFVAYDCASCGVSLDVSCLDGLDEQLLSSPMDTFIEECWASAVEDEHMASPPLSRRNTRTRARSFKLCDDEFVREPSPARDYPGSFERVRPRPPKMTLPLDPPLFPTSPLSPKSFTSFPLSPKSFATSPTYPEKHPTYVLYPGPEGRPLARPAQPQVQRCHKRQITLARSVESLTQPSPGRLQTSKSSYTLRVISDACLPLARTSKKSPLAVS